MNYMRLTVCKQGDHLSDVYIHTVPLFVHAYTFLDSLFTVVPPTIIVGNRDQSFREGATVSLQCQVTGTPQPQVTWEKQGGSLPSNSDIRNDVLT